MTAELTLEQRAAKLHIYPHQVEIEEKYLENVRKMLATTEKTMQVPVVDSKALSMQTVMVIDSVPDFVLAKARERSPVPVTSHRVKSRTPIFLAISRQVSYMRQNAINSWSKSVKENG